MKYASVFAIAASSLFFLGLEAQLSPSHAAKTYRWSSQLAGSCRLSNGVMTIQPTGRVSWSARVASSSSNNAYCSTFTFKDRNGTQVFNWPRICSPTLYPVYRDWNRDNLAVPEYLYDTIRTVNLRSTC